MITKAQSTNHKAYFLAPIFVFCFVFSVFPTYAQEDATASVRDIVREKVKEKLDSLLAKKPTATIGTLTQITDHSFEVRATLDNKTQLVAAKDDTKYFQTIKGKKKEAKFEDLTLGEFVLAMGFKNSSGVLEAQRIIGYDQNPLTFDKQSLLGDVASLDRTALTVKNPKDQQLKTVKITSNTNFTKGSFSDIEVGNRIVVVGTVDNKGSFTALQVHVVALTPSPTTGPISATPTATPTTPL